MGQLVGGVYQSDYSGDEIDRRLGLVSDLETGLADAMDGVAPEFSDHESYSIGDYVWYEGTLYRCIQSHNNWPWVPNHFEESTIADGIEVLRDTGAATKEISELALSTTEGRTVAGTKETSTTATSAHAVGSYFLMRMNVAIAGTVSISSYAYRLCRATASISVGDTLTENTNYVEVTVGGELNAQRPLITVNDNSAAEAAGIHNAIYRGKALGGGVTAAQYAAIAAGTFDDLYIGDYWTIGNITWRIAAFDYYLNTGNTDRCTSHHVVVVPDTALYTAKMNDENTTTGGYVGSKMYTSNLADAKTTINAAFSGHVLTHNMYLCNAVSAGKQSGGAWYDESVVLMNEINLCGSYVYSPGNDALAIPVLSSLDKAQFPLFRYRQDLMLDRYNHYWLRDVVNGNAFAMLNYTGRTSYATASNTCGVRPSFCIY